MQLPTKQGKQEGIQKGEGFLTYAYPRPIVLFFLFETPCIRKNSQTGEGIPFVISHLHGPPLMQITDYRLHSGSSLSFFFVILGVGHRH